MHAIDGVCFSLSHGLTIQKLHLLELETATNIHGQRKEAPGVRVS